MKRLLLVTLSLAAACATPAAVELPRTRVVLREYYPGSVPFVIENLAGRDLAEERSRPLAPGEPPVSLVPDDVMAELLRQMDEQGFSDHAGPRPADPAALGAKGEVTVTSDGDRPRSVIRRSGAQFIEITRAYVECKKLILAVYNFHPPSLQAVTSGASRMGATGAR